MNYTSKIDIHNIDLGWKKNFLLKSNIFCHNWNIVQEPNSENSENSENCLDLIFAAPPCKKVVFVSDENYITSAIGKFMLDMPNPGSIQCIGL